MKNEDSWFVLLDDILDDLPSLEISHENVCFIATTQSKAKELDLINDIKLNQCKVSIF